MLIHVPEDPEAAASARAAIVADRRLTFGAMGLLLVILDHAPEWKVGVAELSRWTNDRRGERSEDPNAVLLLVRELMTHGYFAPSRTNGDSGAVREAEVFAVSRVASDLCDKQQVVYVIGQPGHQIAKVGTTSNLRARLRAIQTGHPFRLQVLWACPGGRRLEAWLHEGLAPRRLQGEWFDFDEFDPVLVVEDGVRKARMMGIE
jgi:hypothetical protein